MGKRAKRGVRIRQPAVAGQFYPADPDELREMIDHCFKHDLGPGPSDDGSIEKGKKDILGIISPHAGYPFSGMCAAHGFKALKGSGKADTTIILGFSHSGLDAGKASTSIADWKTPLGTTKCDDDMIKQFLDKTMIVENDVSIDNEHSIEVQIPFLQHLFKDPQIVPISIPRSADFPELARQITDLVKASGKKVTFIASSDFTHYGTNFGFVPFTDDIDSKIKDLDMGAIYRILELDTDGFLKYLKRTGATICGSAPTTLLIEIMKILDAGEGTLLNHYTSAELTGDPSQSVSYASIIFKDKERHK